MNVWYPISDFKESKPPAWKILSLWVMFTAAISLDGRRCWLNPAKGLASLHKKDPRHIHAELCSVPSFGSTKHTLLLLLQHTLLKNAACRAGILAAKKNPSTQSVNRITINFVLTSCYAGISSHLISQSRKLKMTTADRTAWTHRLLCLVHDLFVHSQNSISDGICLFLDSNLFFGGVLSGAIFWLFTLFFFLILFIHFPFRLRWLMKARTHFGNGAVND